MLSSHGERIGGVSTRTQIEGLSCSIVGSPRSMVTSIPSSKPYILQSVSQLSSTRERRRSYPHDNSRDSSSSHTWWRLDRLTVNPKYRLIIFLKEDLAGLTSMSEGAVTGTTAGMMEGPGAPRFLRKQKPYKLSTNHSALQF